MSIDSAAAATGPHIIEISGNGLSAQAAVSRSLTALTPAGTDPISVEAAAAFAAQGAQFLTLSTMAQQYLTHAGAALIGITETYNHADNTAAGTLTSSASGIDDTAAGTSDSSASGAEETSAVTVDDGTVNALVAGLGTTPGLSTPVAGTGSAAKLDEAVQVARPDGNHRPDTHASSGEASAAGADIAPIADAATLGGASTAVSGLSTGLGVRPASATGAPTTTAPSMPMQPPPGAETAPRPSPTAAPSVRPGVAPLGSGIAGSGSTPASTGGAMGGAGMGAAPASGAGGQVQGGGRSAPGADQRGDGDDTDTDDWASTTEGLVGERKDLQNGTATQNMLSMIDAMEKDLPK